MGDYSRGVSAILEWKLDDFRHVDAAGLTTLSDASIVETSGISANIETIPPAPEAYKRVVEANFRVAAPWSGGETISAATNGTPFGSYVTPGAYSAGTLQVVAESDGSSLVLDASSGDPETVSVTVTEGDGTSGFLLEWSVIGDLPCLAPLESSTPYR